jgi:hypothetical protein
MKPYTETEQREWRRKEEQISRQRLVRLLGGACELCGSTHALYVRWRDGTPTGRGGSNMYSPLARAIQENPAVGILVCSRCAYRQRQCSPHRLQVIALLGGVCERCQVEDDPLALVIRWRFPEEPRAGTLTQTILDGDAFAGRLVCWDCASRERSSRAHRLRR